MQIYIYLFTLSSAAVSNLVWIQTSNATQYVKNEIEKKKERKTTLSKFATEFTRNLLKFLGFGKVKSRDQFLQNQKTIILMFFRE